MPIIYNYTFTGKLQPEGLIRDLSLSYTAKLTHELFNINGLIEVRANGSDVTVVYKSEIDHTREEDANLDTLQSYIQESVELKVNV